MSEKVRWRGGRFSALWPLKAVLFVMRMKGFCKMNVFFAVMRCDVNSDWKRMLLAIILDYCEGSVSILVGKLKIVLYLYELTENLYGSAYSLYAGDTGSVVPLFASGVGVDVDTDLLHHDEEGARVQACGEVP